METALPPQPQPPSPPPPEAMDEPNLTLEEEDAPKINGDLEHHVSSSSESDALVIDEGPPKQSKSDIINPYFNESLFELSQQHHSLQQNNNTVIAKKKKGSPKLREYTQYLGLQPTLQFKCSKCGRAGFESLTLLNEHVVKCNEDAPVLPTHTNNNNGGFKLTRKVFLCSACGTYYENWNLYLHMVEVHRRYLCLYCLGMFSVLDDLCLHIQSRHNVQPGSKDSLDDFFQAYSEPCYIVCCECSKLFNEQDNFFYHNCIGNKKPNIKVAPAKVPGKIKPEDHVTGDSHPVTSCPATKQTEAVEEEDDEIVYSSDSELDFRGYKSDGEPVTTRSKSKESERESEAVMNNVEEVIETRKVPKLSLKLKLGSFPEIEKHSDEDLNDPEDEEEDEDQDDQDHDPDPDQDQEEDHVRTPTPPPEEISEPLPPSEISDNVQEQPEEPIDPSISEEESYMIASSDVPIVELELEQPLDKFDVRVLIQKCLNSTSPSCIYCNHARKIAVNGKQLALHAMAEHRFSAVVHSITAEELIPESFNSRLKECLPMLESTFFSLESLHSEGGVTFSHVFECFQCRYSTTVHKELYLHNRKLHAKNLLLCIMCKSNFYSYSELICHMCPGVYVLDYDVEFRCCMCVMTDNLPSAFRLMVHLRKAHHVCDVCLEMCHSQYRLSNHVWKHKLHHFCYRCCIAYRNKPDITRHLFWKHGTESVMCKRCLQKKWPHVYHFCVPPSFFTCEECNLTFSKAVALKVHKRIHSEDPKPHPCTFSEDCQERFVSKKLLAKHETKHREPEITPPPLVEETPTVAKSPEAIAEKPDEELVVAVPEEEKPKPKPKVDVYDLPALNLSESDSSDSESDTKAVTSSKVVDSGVTDVVETVVPGSEGDAESEQVMENIWENFKNYQASKEKFDHSVAPEEDEHLPPEAGEQEVDVLKTVLMDHDYCVDPDQHKPDVTFVEATPDLSQSVDHDYCTAADKTESAETSHAQTTTEAKKNSSSSDSSSDSDSSCSCGPNCSCSSSSSSSSSDSSNSDSSTEEGRKRQQLRREKRRQKKNAPQVATSSQVPPQPAVTAAAAVQVKELPIQESDLETTESETDEEFYDKQPQKLAKKLLEERRNQVLAGIELSNSRAPTPNIPVEEEQQQQQQAKQKKSKSSKSKKKKKRRSEQRRELRLQQYYQQQQQQQQQQMVAPITLTISRNSPVPQSLAKPPQTPPVNSSAVLEDDSNLRASKRRRVPNKFYGYSSEEEEEQNRRKWRKNDLPSPQMPLIVPPITIKTIQPPVQPISIRMTQPGQLKVQPPLQRKLPPIKLKTPIPKFPSASTIAHADDDSEMESNDSSGEGRNALQRNPNALYCYCKCPYDEVSEMIGCDSRDCSIEWFHFECVGIMVPPKGHWYCPECRKKRQQKRDMLKLKTK